MKGFSIESVENTKEDVVITYTPSSDVFNYSYRIIKNNVYGDYVYVNSNLPFTIVLDSTGNYKIEVTSVDLFGNSTLSVSGEYKIDKEAPILNVQKKTYKVNQGKNIEFLNGVSASDAVDGDITTYITTNISDIDFNTVGIKTLQYSVSDKAGNTATEVAYVTVVKDNTNLIRVGQFGIVLGLILIFLFLYKYIRSIKFEKRFSKYTINSSKNNSISLFDSLYNQYISFLNKMAINLSKSKFLMNKAKRYNKYTQVFEMNGNNMLFMSRKIVVGFIYLIVAVVVRLVQSKMIPFYEMIIPFIIGFYTLDVIYIYRYNKYRKKIENDMLEAITVMNNAFKSGRSIIQAVELVSVELDGAIAKEFATIKQELLYGLDVEVAFKRFADRIKLTEAVYLTSSLSVLNKTGGNIIKVFNSIEKTMFSKKKLQSELKSLTSSSRMIMYVLIFVPIAFVAFISIVNIGYFEPLFTNVLGYALIFIMIVIYITYIIIVRKVMKIRM